MTQRFLFHAAPPRAREQIRNHGLRPATPTSSRLVAHGPAAVYLFRWRQFAENYRLDEAYDVWRVDTDGLDLYADPEDPEAAVYCPARIDPRRLRLLGTYCGGERTGCSYRDLSRYGYSSRHR